jgi:HlyD family secretion protein
MSPSERSATAGTVTLGRLLLFGGAAWVCGMAFSAWLAAPSPREIPAELQAKMIAVSVPRPAVLAELFVKPGQTVTPQTPLFRLADDRLADQIDDKRREQTLLVAEVARAEATAEVDLEWRRRALQEETFQIELRAAELLQARVHQQVEQLAWREQLDGEECWVGGAGDMALEPFALPADEFSPARLQVLLYIDNAASALEANTVQLGLCERQLAALADLETRLTQKVRVSAGVDVAKAKLTRAEEELAALEQQERELTIRSPGFGVVGSLTVQPGDTLAGGQCVIELLDEEQRFLVAQVPSAALSGFQAGDKVSVRFAPRQRWEGIVAEIPPQAQPGQTGEDATIPIRILPAGKLWPQRPIGSRVTIEIPRT